MKTTKTLLFSCLLFLGLVLSKTSSAQTTYTTSPDAENWTCGLDSAIMVQLANDTGFVGRMARYNYAVANPGNQIQSGSPYIVPVVFHLIGTTTPTITYNQVKWQLARINAAFQNQINLFNGQPNGARSVNTQIEFRLACTAQNCGGWSSTTEPGVMRYGGVTSTVANQITLAPSTFTPMLAITHPSGCPNTFPFANYLNIWCVPSIDGGSTIGYGTFPWLNAGIDGIVMDIDVIGNNSYLTGFPLLPQLDKGAILAHELGHYLGLYHTFQPQTLGCTLTPNLAGAFGCYGTTTVTAMCEGDLVKDTPPTAIHSDLGGIAYWNSCNETNFPYGNLANENDQLENYMSYSDDDKMNTFTQGQANRMISSFTMTAPGNRFNLNNPTNLIATGVYTNSCSNLTGLVSAMFNYSIAPNSNCSNINIQFTNPVSLGFTATSWNWSFGATTPNPIKSYVVTGGSLYTVVTMTASNGTVSATYTRTINININARIIGQSGSTKVCKGTEQTIFIEMSPGVPSVSITDGTTVTTVLNTMNTNTTVVIPYTFTANANASYSMVPASCGTLNLGSATFNVYDCCNNMLTNGNFNSDITGWTTQLTSILPSNASICEQGYAYFGTYSITTPTGWWGFPNQTGQALLVDGFACNNGIVNAPYGCGVTSTVVPIVLQQTVTALSPNTDYFYSFKITDNYFTNPNCRLNFSTKISNSTTTLLPTQSFTPTINYISPFAAKPYYYEVYTYTLTTPSNITATDVFSVTLNQVNNFRGTGYDYYLDNFTFNQITPSIQAIGNNTICPAQSTTLSAVASCSNSTANYTYLWSPNTSLSANNIMTPTANPTTTTVYTLIATPISTVGTPPTIISTVTVTVKPTFIINPANTFLYAGQCATLTVAGSTGAYTWMPGSLTGTAVTVCPTANTIYTVTNAASGTCTANNTATVIVSTACSQSATATYSNYIFPTGTYSATNQVFNLAGTITFTNNTTFIGYTFRMAPGTQLFVTGTSVLTLDNCKLFSCTELWEGIKLESFDRRTRLASTASIDVKNGTTIEDMYAGINIIGTNTVSTGVTGYIKINNSRLNKNYVGVQLNSISGNTLSGTAYSLTVKNSTITTASSITSPGNNLKPSTIPGYTYAYNKIAGGASGGTTSYTAFPRGYVGIYLNNLSVTNPVIIGDSAGTANTFNTFSNLDFGIAATNAQLRVHNNAFVNLKGSTKQYDIGDIFNPNPTPIGPDEIGIAVIAQHTVANTYSLQVGTKSVVATMNLGVIYPKSNTFKTLNKGVSAKNCNVVIAKGNWFEADTTDIPVSDYLSQGSPNTYDYYKGQSAVWITGLSKGSTLMFNYIRNYRVGLNVSQTMSVTAGAYVTIKNNNIQSLSTVGYCKQAINLEQVGGANIAPDLLDVSNNTINRVFNGIYAKSIAGGLNISGHSNITLDNVKTYGKQFPNNYNHTGISLASTSNAKIINNTNINSVFTGAFTASTCTLTNAVFVTTSPNNTITCNSTNNVGRGFYFQGNCTSPNGWLGNAISNSYRGLELKTSGVIGAQGTAPSGTLAANTWSNVTQETFVSGTTNANTSSRMYVEANGTFTTAPTLNFGTASQIYINAPSFGIDVKTGTPFSCGGGGTFMAMSASAPASGATTSITNDALYSNLATNSNTVYPTYADEMTYHSKQLVYALQKQGLVTKNATNPTLQSFYNSNINSNIGKFTDVQDAVASNNKTLAQNKNNSINPTNAVQQKTKRANELMLKLNINCNYKFTNTELQDLVSMANECEVKGWYVAEARSILNTISGTLNNYADNCEDTKASARMANAEPEPVIAIEPANEFLLYPNPNNGQMELQYTIHNKQAAQLIIMDVTGRLINQYELSENSSNLHINELELKSGVYFYSIKQNNSILKQAKFVIMK